MKKIVNHTSSIWAPLLMFGVLLLIWQMVVMIAHVPPWLLPKPLDVARSIVVDFHEYLPHILISYSNTLIGFMLAVIIGIVLAALINNYQLLGIALTPYITMLCTTPMITLVPLLMLWIGFGQKVQILAVVLQAFPIVNMNSLAGYQDVETLKLELMDSLRAGKVRKFFHCIFPASLPSVFTGMKLAGIFATTACTGAEFTGGNTGLGAQIIANTQFMHMDKAFACIFFVAFIGVFLYLAVTFAEWKIVKWKI